jgi:peptidoglycan/xylan/chitin deacetylase (PgdA/CDA1 family)
MKRSASDVKEGKRPVAPLVAKVPFDRLAGRCVRRLRKWYGDRCVNIVVYHRISGVRSPLDFGGSPRHTPTEFERQVDYLAHNYDVVSLRALLEGLERDEISARAAIITFDDGYADTLGQALPILRRRRIPMTVFLATSAVGNCDLLWHHKLAWLAAHGHEGRVEDALRADGITGRREGESIAQFAKRSFRPELPYILESVLRSLGTSGAMLAARMRPYIEPEEIAGADGDFVEFGNHTHTHPVLSALSAEQQYRDISAARDVIFSLTGASPAALAYPFGRERHYNADSKRLAQETWHRAALDMRRHANHGRVDPFALSRKPAPVGSQRLFEQLMEDWPTSQSAAQGIN